MVVLLPDTSHERFEAIAEKVRTQSLSSEVHKIKGQFAKVIVTKLSVDEAHKVSLNIYKFIYFTYVTVCYTMVSKCICILNTCLSGNKDITMAVGYNVTLFKLLKLNELCKTYRQLKTIILIYLITTFMATFMTFIHSMAITT